MNIGPRAGFFVLIRNIAIGHRTLRGNGFGSIGHFNGVSRNGFDCTVSLEVVALRVFPINLESTRRIASDFARNGFFWLKHNVGILKRADVVRSRVTIRTSDVFRRWTVSNLIFAVRRGLRGTATSGGRDFLVVLTSPAT
ncbi:hypothetical protein D3C71_1435300 [compost metagenome]